MRQATFVLASIAALATTRSSEAQIKFTDVTKRAGITFSQVDNTLMMGAGCAFVDIDDDSFHDIVFNGGLHTPTLYRNQQDGTFDLATGAQALPFFRKGSIGLGVFAADVENDGDADLFFGNLGPDAFYRNLGDGTFVDDTETARLYDVAFTTAAAFGDYDQDGFLDLYVGNYIAVLNFPFHTPWPNVLHHNRGDGTFEDVTKGTNTAGAGTTLAASWSDFDQDGDSDLFVGNDFGAYVEPNRLYRNEGIGPAARWKFSEVSSALGADLKIFCMGIAAGDYDHDNDLDYYFTNLGRNVLLRNDGAAGFTDVATSAGCEGTYDPFQVPLFATSWGEGFHDFDHDTFVDLFVSNGYIPAAPFIANSQNTPNFLYRNLGNSTFTEIAATAAIDSKRVGRGAAFADFDHDGDIDVLQANINDAPQLFRNDSPGKKHFLRLAPVGWKSNRDGNGAHVVADVGGTKLLREANGNYSFESSSDSAVHFGLPDRTPVDSLIVSWPSGIVQHRFSIATDASEKLVEPRATLITNSTALPSALSVAEDLRLDFAVLNHDTTPHSLTWRVDLVTDDKSTVLFQGAGTLPPGQNAPLTLSLELPHGAKGRATVLLSLTDAAGGIDQWRGVTVLGP